MSDLGNLKNLLKDESKSLADLEWLDVDEKAYQELDRLPQQNLDIVPDLEEQWGKLTDADRYRLSPENREPTVPNTPFWAERSLPSYLDTEEKIKEVEKFVRTHLMAGTPASKTASLLKSKFDSQTLSESESVIRTAFKEAGLIGEVYIDSTLFDRCDQGQGQDFVSKYNKSAKFVLAKDKCATCVWAKDQKCSRFQKDLVFDVQYNDDLWDFYKAKAEALGKDLRSITPDMSVQAKIKMASLAPVNKGPARLDGKPIMKDPADKVSFEDAQKSLKTAKGDRQVLTNVKKEQKVRQALQDMLAGKHDLVRDRMASDEDLSVVKPHLYLMGNLYADLSLFDSRKAADEFVKARGGDLLIYGSPDGTKTASTDSFSVKSKASLQKILYRYAAVQSVDPITLKEVAKKLFTANEESVRKFAQSLYAKPYTRTTDQQSYTQHEYTTVQTKVAKQKVSSKQVSEFRQKISEHAPKKVGRNLSYFLKCAGGDDLLSMLNDRLGHEVVRCLWLAQDKVSTTVQDFAKKSQFRNLVLSSVVDDEYTPTGRNVILGEMFQSKVGRWMRDRLLAGSSGQKLSSEIRQAFSEDEIVDNAYIILAMREQEGLFGTAYGMSESFEDCQKGKRALQPTANQIVKSDKCSGCVYNKTARCLMYGRDLVSEPRYTEQNLRDVLSFKVKSRGLTKEDAQLILQSRQDIESKIRTASRMTSSSKGKVSDSTYTGFYGSSTEVSSTEKRLGHMLKDARQLVLKGHSEEQVRETLSSMYDEKVMKMGSVYLDQIIDRTRDYMGEVVDSRNVYASTGLDQMEEYGLDPYKTSSLLSNIEISEDHVETETEGVSYIIPKME
jgi:hypothetical protein